jgi:hypothetical protein
MSLSRFGKENPNGIPGFQPKVATQKLPWLSSPKIHHPQRGCGHPFALMINNRSRTALGLMLFSARTQGSSCLTTLG